MLDFLQTLLYPIKLGEAWVMYAWHWLFDLVGLPTGWAWAMSIVGLTVVVRLLLIPLFVKQIHSSRRMQMIQPEMQKIQKKYKGKRDPESQKAQQAEMMDLYRRTGTNPFSSCLPILIQSPFFFGLFQLLNNLRAQSEGKQPGIGPITNEVARTIESSTIFGARLSDAFMTSPDVNVKIFTAVLIVLMSATTFTTQYQLMRKNMPAAALDNPFAKQQKVLLYLMPFFFMISGINFPIGVLLYWLTTNLWTMGQQFYVIRNMPAPGSEAEKAQRERMKRKGKTVKELVVPGLGTAVDEVEDDAPRSGQRQQPKGKKRAKGARPGVVGANVSSNTSSDADGADVAVDQGADQDADMVADGAAPDPTRDGAVAGARAATGSSGSRSGGSATSATSPGSRAARPGTATSPRQSQAGRKRKRGSSPR
ncbi:membrane protein insertase YidC [Terracoccus luteus]|uniref:Membrane protein insertase YidC n=1 Tax=Terracoccus luteus TaxID=53356 RepID=A0A839Q2D7_9MICO|nr:membrane protein insertase YidC [Terracoccus luteus]MBB2987262.1 YidC/Oxa1 family membrane protein insertase [Terracoccus luteus]MCP2172913.1 YidC/Oxa1 family membrane protein insertase [Terracoccus luteus]